MTEKKENIEKMKKRYQEAMTNDIEFSIITALRWNKTLNLKKIAKLVDKPESTTIRYLKKLLEDEIITIDLEKTAASWGKFYRLSKLIEDLYDQNKERMSKKNQEEFEELMEYLDQPAEEIEKYAINKILGRGEEESELNLKDAKRNLTLMHNVEDMILNEFIEAAREFSEYQKELGKDFLRENLSLSPVDILLSNKWAEISNFKHLLRFYQIFGEFDQKIEKLKEEIKKEMDEENIPQENRITMIIDFFMGGTEVKYSINEKEK